MSTRPQPWSPERRSQIKRKLDKEAERAAGRLGATHVTLIAFFAEGEHLHMQDGGTAPMPQADLYAKLATATEVLKQSGGEDVELQ